MLVEGADAWVLDEEGGCWAAAAGLASDGALLVRPDEFIAWRADELPHSPATDLRRVLCQILGRTP